MDVSMELIISIMKLILLIIKNINKGLDHNNQVKLHHLIIQYYYLKKAELNCRFHRSRNQVTKYHLLNYTLLIFFFYNYIFK